MSQRQWGWGGEGVVLCGNGVWMVVKCKGMVVKYMGMHWGWKKFHGDGAGMGLIFTTVPLFNGNDQQIQASTLIVNHTNSLLPHYSIVIQPNHTSTLMYTLYTGPTCQWQLFQVHNRINAIEICYYKTTVMAICILTMLQKLLLCY